MLKADRMAAILEAIAQDGSVDVTRVSADLGVSPATLRRDLQALHEQGLLVRTHGGAVAGGVGIELPSAAPRGASPTPEASDRTTRGHSCP